jgi:CheY-like chemotaxis protein
MIKKSSNRLINTITSYMDISMIVSGLTEINKRRFSLKSFLKKINDETTETSSSRNLGLKIITRSPKEDVDIVTDEILLEKIFKNLLDNAIKFTKSGSITIGYDFRSGYHYFSVSDTGTGISDDSLSVIFELFRQADLSISRSYEGSGLGLSIARGFVKLLGGEIWVESVVDEGSTFFFTIPTDSASSHFTASDFRSFQPDQPVILVAEDDDSNYKYLEIVLKRASYHVLRAKNGYETVDTCRSHPELNLLLTDMKMPGMDGLESTRIIRELLPNLPIIGLSGLISTDDEDAARSAGCNDYMVKPVSKIKLLDTIKRLLYQAGINQ